MEDLQVVQTYSMPEERKIIYEWKVDHFFSIMRFALSNKEESTIQSPVFSTINNSVDSSWYLTMKLSHVPHQGEYFAMALTYCGGHQTLRARYSISFIDDDGNKQLEQIGTKIFKNSVGHIIRQPRSVSEMLKEARKIVPDETFTVHLELTEFIVRSYASPPITKLRFKRSKQIVDDLPAIFHSKEGSDIVLVVGDKRIPAHKTLLMNRNTVFRSILTHHSRNTRSSVVNIPDMDPDILEKLLEFIYTNNVTNLDEVAERLYEVADKYQIPALKKLCEESLCKTISVGNAVQYLVLLNRYNADGVFLNYIADFIAINSKIITQTEEYKALLNTNPSLLLAVLTKIYSSK
ncbi:speckle-type POZ protein-like isoform X1 [Microplitis mediator]|uniref:speckle-type POZ protein-like isoform X1 n=1 Tax=Microplitis mediator TaxID=375433 RepID=UPI002556D5C7|nr:speckle-type POZ protein-like isoform X1 [Microplitis mediator]